MKIRRGTSADNDQLRKLFHDTINHINNKDYNAEQIAVWSAGADKPERWLDKLKNQYFFVAEEDDIITGFASVTLGAYLDFMFVHKDYQGRGIAKSLLKEIIDLITKLGREAITADVSITAKPFFLKHGFAVVEEQTVMLQNIPLTNYKMIRSINHL